MEKELIQFYVVIQEPDNSVPIVRLVRARTLEEARGCYEQGLETGKDNSLGTGSQVVGVMTSDQYEIVYPNADELHPEDHTRLLNL